MKRKSESSKVSVRFLVIALTLLLVVTSSSPFISSANATKPKGGDFIVRLNPNANLSSFLVAEIKNGLVPVEVFSSVFPGFQAKLSTKTFARLKKDKRVAAISRVTTFSVPRSPVFRNIGYVWGIDRIDQRTLPMDRVFAPPATGAGVTAFVIDSGVDATHPELAGRVRTGFSSVDQSDGTTDCTGHGTHVAGTIGGSRVGVASNVTIVPIKVLRCDGRGTTSEILRGIDAVLQLRRGRAPAVANLSLGGGIDPALDAGVRAMVDAGITVVVAAGNASKDACTVSPAREPRVLTVAAVDLADQMTSFSNFGRCVDVFAPGKDIISTWPSNRFASANGTSMAAPHVAGAAALLLEAAPELQPGDVTARLLGRSTAGVVRGASSSSPNRLLFIEPSNALPSPTTTAPPTTTTIATRGPGIPRNLTVSVSGSDATLFWDPPIDNGGSFIFDYVIDYWAKGGSSWVRVSDGTSASTFASIRSLPSNTYSFRVSAVNTSGIGSFVQSGDVNIGPSTTTTTSTTTSTTTTTTIATGSPSLESDSLSKNSMVLQSNINSNAVYWTVRVRDPFGGRLSSSTVGARLCPESSSWPDGPGCTGATATGSGNSLDRTYTFLFLVSPDGPTGQWLPRMFGPVSGQPDIVGRARISINR